MLKSYIRFSYVSNENENYFSFSLVPGVTTAFLTLTSFSGLAITTKRPNGGWFSYWRYCSGGSPISTNDWSKGCAPDKPSRPSCAAGDKFVAARELVGGFDANIPINGSDNCEDICINNCSCIAYYYSASKDGQRCFFSADAQISGDFGFYGSGHVYIRQSHKGRQPWVPIVVPVISVILLVLVTISLWYIRRSFCVGENGNNQDGRRRAFYELGGLNAASRASKPQSSIKMDSELPLLSFSQIECATGNFSHENKLGQGGFGPVYKGKLANGQEIAVKRLSSSSAQGIEEFKNEVILILKLQHRNLVRLVGCCIQGEEKLLIYEYMPNKSLDSFLFDPKKRLFLYWRRRFRIIEGVAQGLLYLHKYSRLRIVHRDLKTSNILLDVELNPKISDFGLARSFADNESRANTDRIVGTYGYMSPEYAMDGIFSVKSDVYSYGVMLLEIISGKKNTSFHYRNRFMNLLGYAWDLWKEERSLELIDPGLEGISCTVEIIRCTQIGLLCVQENAVDRPNMSDVVSMLTNEMMALPTPKQPAFFITIGATSDAEQSHEQPTPVSVNKVTISTVIGR